MRTLLILGSKPEPALPPSTSFDDVACINASGHSAARLGLPDPVYTVMTSMLASGIASGRQSLKAMRGLKTARVYALRRRTRSANPLKEIYFFAKNLRTKNIWRMQPSFLRRSLSELSYEFGEFVALDASRYDGLVEKLCESDPQVLAQLARKRTSSGVVALALGLADYDYDRYVISGFSFELSHAYGHNPEIDERGTTVSSHAESDIAVLRHIGQTRTDVFTSEAVVHRQTGLPMLPDPAARPEAQRAGG